MKNYTIYFLAFGIIVLLVSCNSGFKNLSCNYWYTNDNWQVVRGGGYEILSRVVDYNYNDNFIIVLQEPNYEGYISSIESNIRSMDSIKYRSITIANVNETERLADSILKTDSFDKKVFSHKVNYWIVACKDSTQLFGPLTKDEYLRKRKELKIPMTLWLWD